MEHPRAINVPEAMRKPLRLKQVEAIVGEIQRLAASVE